MIKTIITDGIGLGGSCTIIDNALLTTHLPYPPLTPQKIIPFRQHLTLDGTSTGTSSMLAVGSLASPVSFYVTADGDNDRYITQLSFMIAGASPKLNQFGNITALTNGCNLYYYRTSGKIILHPDIKSNFDLLRLCLGNPAFGSAATAFQAGSVIGTSEAYIPVLDLTKFMPPYGIKLDRGTTQTLSLDIRDNTTTVLAMDCIAYGFDRLL